MFDFGWSELIVISTVALIFMGSKGFADVLRTLRQWMSGIGGGPPGE